MIFFIQKSSYLPLEFEFLLNLGKIFWVGGTCTPRSLTISCRDVITLLSRCDEILIYKPLKKYHKNFLPNNLHLKLETLVKFLLNFLELQICEFSLSGKRTNFFIEKKWERYTYWDLLLKEGMYEQTLIFSHPKIFKPYFDNWIFKP